MTELTPDELERQQREFYAGWKIMTGQNLEKMGKLYPVTITSGEKESPIPKELAESLAKLPMPLITFFMPGLHFDTWDEAMEYVRTGKLPKKKRLFSADQHI